MMHGNLTAKVLWSSLTAVCLQACNAWAQHGLAIVGFITGAAKPIPTSFKGRWVFGPNTEVKNVFYNGALQYTAQQLYLSMGISYVSDFNLLMCC
jgi:hypothetical protein